MLEENISYFIALWAKCTQDKSIKLQNYPNIVYLNSWFLLTILFYEF